MEISPVVLISRKPVATTSESHWGNWINFGNKKPPRELLMIIALPLTSVPRHRDDERAFKLNFNVRVVIHRIKLECGLLWALNWSWIAGITFIVGLLWSTFFYLFFKWKCHTITYLSLKIKYLNNKDLKQKRGILYSSINARCINRKADIKRKRMFNKAKFHWNKMLALLNWELKFSYLYIRELEYV